MAVPTSPAGRRPQLADRLAAARRRRFVGREAELALFAAALADPEPPFALLYVHGPGGVGKSLLLSEFARLAEDAGVPAVSGTTGRDLDPSPPGFLAALGRALDEPPDTSPLEALARRPRDVLMVDIYETLGPLDAWLREALLPELPGGHLVVLAGRDPPAAGWLADAGWRDLARVVPLRNLRPEESLAYLSARGVPAAQHAAVLSFTHGHPPGPVAGRRRGRQRRGPDRPGIRAAAGRGPGAAGAVRAAAPRARHRQALEACAHVRVTTEALLASALDADDAHELFGWLRRLSFVEEGPYGLFPHDLAREVLDTDLRWRNPESYLELHRRGGRLRARLPAADRLGRADPPDVRPGGLDHRTGLRLARIYRGAGLPAPETLQGARVESGPDSPVYASVAQTTRTLLPLMERTGVATAAEVAVDTLAVRLRDQVVAADATVVPPPLIGAWARKPAR